MAPNTYPRAGPRTDIALKTPAKYQNTRIKYTAVVTKQILHKQMHLNSLSKTFDCKRNVILKRLIR